MNFAFTQTASAAVAYAADDEMNFSSDKESEEDSVDGSAQFMVEQMPMMPPPQLIKPLTPQQPAIPAQETTEQSDKKENRWVGFAKKLFSKDKDQSAEEQSVAETSSETAADDAKEQAQAIEKAADDLVEKAAVEKAESSADVDEQIEPFKSAPADTAPSASTADSIKKEDATPAKDEDYISKTTSILQEDEDLGIKEADETVKPSESAIEEKPLPAEPSAGSDTGETDVNLKDLPQKQGIYLIAPLEAEMKEAAQSLDF